MTRAEIKELLESDEFRQMVRETALSIVVEQDRIAKLGIPRAFLASCRIAGYWVYLQGGQVRVRRPDGGPLCDTIRCVLDLYRREIAEWLRENKREQLLPPRPPPNGTAPTQRKQP